MGFRFATLLSEDRNVPGVRSQATTLIPHGAQSKKTGNKAFLKEGFSDVKCSRERKNLQFRPSSIKKSSPDEPLLRSAHGITIDPNFSGSPENSKLKGVLWPGMNLFDAATDEMRRQRNQKKDGSTLRQMEITSKSVQPREVVYSEDWTPMKQREITGLADEDSPLEGEAYIPKKPVRRRKSVLTEASVNVPRASHSTARSANPRGLSYPFEYTEMHRKPLLTLPSSLTGAALETKSRFSPTEDENIEFKLTLGHLAQRRKGGNITVFNDRGDADMPHTTADQIRGSHPLLVPQNQASHVRPPMSLLSASWLQSPYQQPLPYHNLHTAHAQSGSAHLHTKYLSSSKENINPWSMRGDEAQLNPLSWDRSGALAQSQFGVYHQLGYDGSHIALCGLSPNDDVFGYSANPLSAAFPHLQDHPESPFKTSETSQAIHYPVDTKTKSLSPNGTISDHSAGEYSQSVFASYE